MKRDQFQKERARKLREKSTPAETIMWGMLRNRRFAKFKFRRQHPFGPYYLDFYCLALGLVVELDGQTHVGTEKKDAERQRKIEAAGLHVIRVWNSDVYEKLDSVMTLIFNECSNRSKSI